MSPERSHYQISFEEVVSNAKDVMRRDGNYVPILIMEASSNLLIGQIPDMPATHGERIELMRFLGQAAAKSGRVDQLQQVFMVFEGWMSTKSAEIRPSQDPNRKEVLIISAIQMKERKKQIRLFEILRDSHEKVSRSYQWYPSNDKRHYVQTLFFCKLN